MVSWHQAAAGRTRCTTSSMQSALCHIFVAWFVHGSWHGSWGLGHGPHCYMYMIVLLSHLYAVCRLPSEANAVDKVQTWLDHRSCMAHRYIEKVCTVGVCACVPCAGECCGTQNSEFWQLQHTQLSSSGSAHQHITDHRPLAVGGYSILNVSTKSASGTHTHTLIHT
jgi:hypothetical protein